MTQDHEQQQRDRGWLAATADLAVDNAVLDHYDAFKRATQATQTGFVVEATIGYLLGEGLISVTEDARDRERFSLRIADHLKPDPPAAPPRLP